MFTRSQKDVLAGRLREAWRFIQVVTGPRQVGKSTLVQQAVESAGGPFHSASADEPTLRGRAWIEQQWETARLKAKDAGGQGVVLVLDEIQKISDWSETVKLLWDADSRTRTPLKVVLLGSSPLLIQRGLTESLAGRFELIHLPHWSFAEMRDAFGWDVDTYVLHGGYPGAATLVSDPERWARYVKDALVETTIARDVLLLSRVDKPALLRRLFELACRYSGQVLSYQKMLGQLQDAGNTTTLAHYLDLLTAAGMATGLQKYAGEVVRQRGSSPKLQVLNTALMTAQLGLLPQEIRRQPDLWGRLVESAVGAHLANAAASGQIELFYWRERSREVDFVVRCGRIVTAIEVKSGRARESLAGMEAFGVAFNPNHKLLVGGTASASPSFSPCRLPAGPQCRSLHLPRTLGLPAHRRQNPREAVPAERPRGQRAHTTTRGQVRGELPWTSHRPMPASVFAGPLNLR